VVVAGARERGRRGPTLPGRSATLPLRCVVPGSRRSRCSRAAAQRTRCPRRTQAYLTEERPLVELNKVTDKPKRVPRMRRHPMTATLCRTHATRAPRAQAGDAAWQVSAWLPATSARRTLARVATKAAAVAAL